jgi:predicted O-linked N-acetylglucosamine transferase (SPINDLY family)
VPQAIEQAVRLHQQGRLAEAERLYRELLRTRPRDVQALHMLGLLQLRQGMAQEAVQLIAAALAIDPRSAAAHSHHAMALSALNRREEALASFERSLAIRPRDAETLTYRADTLCDLGRRAEALAGYDKALAINPRLVGAWVNRGIVLCELGQSHEALVSQDKALAIDPSDVVAWNNRGIALAQLGRHGEALGSYERALALSPDDLDALMNRANTLLTLNRPAEALAGYARVLALSPGLADAHANRAHAFSDLHRFDDAIAGYDKAIALNPDHPEARLHRARVLSKLGRDAEALSAYRQLRAIRPQPPILLNDYAACLTATCQWDEAARVAAEVAGATAGADSVMDPFMLLRFDTAPEQQLAAARRWLQYKKIEPATVGWDRAAFPSDRIRIAYLSADFHRHATAHLIAELFELHDRSRFEIVGVSYGPDDQSDIRSRLVTSFDRFFDVTTRGDEDVAALLRDLKVSIAVDLKGHTEGARLGILARRAAPVQVTYLGYPATTGADFIDYLLADPMVLPFDQQPYCTEKIIHLPDCYQVNDSKRRVAEQIPSRGEAGLPEHGVVFCCFNNSWKLNAAMFDVWMRLLQTVEGSVLWLYQTNALAADTLRKKAQARGVDPQRLIFAPPLEPSEHLARLKLANLFLDTLPYNAHTTASDSLWTGVPLLTCKGPTFAGRVAASLLHAVGLPELVTESLDDYEQLALKLAREPALLGAMRNRLALRRFTHPLFDSDRFTRHIEAAYATMWETWQRGDPPHSFAVNPLK